MSKFSSLYAIPSKNGLTKPRAIRGEGIKFINMGELFQSHRIGDIQTERVPVTEKELREALLQEGDLLFARQSLVREGAGKCSVVTEVSEPTTYDSHLIRVRLDRKVANPYFFQYYFSSALSPIPGIVSQCAQAGIKGTDLGNLDVFCPNLDLQNRIVDVLEAYDKLIENNRRQIALLEEAAQRLYKEWFVDLRFPGYETTPIIGGLPEGWRKVALGSFIESHIGGGWGSETSTSDFNVEAFVVRATDISNISNGNLSLPLRWHKESNFRTRSLAEGDIVFEVSGGSKEVGVGRSMIVSKQFLKALDRPVICASFCKKIRCRSVSDAYLLYEQIQMDLTAGGVRKYEKRSAGNIINFHWEDFLKSYQVIVPDDGTLSLFSIQISCIRKQAENCKMLCMLAKEARDRLLPKLVSGEIEVG